MHTRSSETTTLYNSSQTRSAQRTALRSGEVPVAVYGLGKMGLPLATVFAELTDNTTGVDIDPDVVSTINRGECPVDGEPGLPELVADTVADGSLTAVSDPADAAAEAAIHVIIVPTLVDDETPDLAALRAVTGSIGRGLSSGDLVCVESTVPPRTCRDVVRPILEAESDLEFGSFGLAFCPERTSSGRALEDIRGAYPKIVGGIDDESTRAAAVVYDEVTDNDVHVVSDATTAECVKIFEGVYRDVNIALANELAKLADELQTDVIEAIEAANTQPYCDIHMPGPGVGGHCIPYYPYFLIEPFDTETPLLETARGVNDSMPSFTVEKLLEEFSRHEIAPGDATVVVLGVAYRPGVDETRESPGLAIIERLIEIGIDVCAVDPIVDIEMEHVQTLRMDQLSNYDFDGAILVTDHEAFDEIQWADIEPTALIDGRNVISEGDGVSSIRTIGVSNSDVPNGYFNSK